MLCLSIVDEEAVTRDVPHPQARNDGPTGRLLAGAPRRKRADLRTGAHVPGSARVGDGDREEVINLLVDAFADGRLTRDEFDARSAEALAARTGDDLKPADGGSRARLARRSWSGPPGRSTPSSGRGTSPRREAFLRRHHAPAHHRVARHRPGHAVVVPMVRVARARLGHRHRGADQAHHTQERQLGLTGQAERPRAQPRRRPPGSSHPVASVVAQCGRANARPGPEVGGFYAGWYSLIKRPSTVRRRIRVAGRSRCPRRSPRRSDAQGRAARHSGCPATSTRPQGTT